MDKLIRTLTETFGPSGMESSVRKVIVEEIKDLPVEIAVDPLGNLLVTRKGGAGGAAPDAGRAYG